MQEEALLPELDHEGQQPSIQVYGRNKLLEIESDKEHHVQQLPMLLLLLIFHTKIVLQTWTCT